MISATLMSAIRDDLDEWEGMYLWMYLDTQGLVTVGYGTQLPNAAAACNLKFVDKKTGRIIASALEIQAEWNKVHNGSAKQRTTTSHHKHVAQYYDTITTIRIENSTARTLRDKHVYNDYLELKKIYTHFDDFPDDAKLALFDMIYNLGPGRGKSRQHRASGLRQYSKMNDAIRAQDWATAAATSRRNGIPADRNKSIASLFNGCVVRSVPAGAGKPLGMAMP